MYLWRKLMKDKIYTNRNHEFILWQGFLVRHHELVIVNTKCACHRNTTWSCHRNTKYTCHHNTNMKKTLLMNDTNRNHGFVPWQGFRIRHHELVNLSSYTNIRAWPGAVPEQAFACRRSAAGEVNVRPQPGRGQRSAAAPRSPRWSSRWCRVSSACSSTTRYSQYIAALMEIQSPTFIS